MYDSAPVFTRVDSRLFGTGDPLQGDMPRFGEHIRTAERPCSIGVPAARVAARSGHCESTFVPSVKTAGL